MEEAEEVPHRRVVPTEAEIDPTEVKGEVAKLVRPNPAPKDTPQCPLKAVVTAIINMVIRLGTALNHSHAHGKTSVWTSNEQLTSLEKREMKFKITTTYFQA